MLRIQCACGKSLKVNDMLVGKKIKCPTCSVVQLVTAAPDLDECVAAPLPKKTPARQAQVAVPVPNKQRSRDPEEVLAKTKQAKHEEKPVPWRVIGGGAGALVLLLVGVWFFFLRGVDEKPASEPAKKEVPVALKPFVPENKPQTPEVPETAKDSPRAPNPGEVLLNNAKVEWIPGKVQGKPAVKASAAYSIPPDTRFKANSYYCLCVEYTGGDGTVSVSPGITVGGNGLEIRGNLTEAALIIMDLPKDGLLRCDVALYEIAGIKEKVLLAAQRNVEISGVPPTLPAPPGDIMGVELSNAKVELLATKKLRFSADYKIKDQKLVDKTKNYILIAKLEGKASKTVVVGKSYAGAKLVLKTSLTPAELGTAATVGTNFEVWLAEAAGPTDADGKRLSTIAKGQVTAAVTDPTPDKLQFQLDNITATVTPGAKMSGVGGKKSGGQVQQPAVLHLQVHWTKSAGDLNPKAAYALCAIVQGVQTPLRPLMSGTTFPTTYQFKQDIPNAGKQNFNLAIVEFLPGQTQGLKVSQDYPVRLR